MILDPKFEVDNISVELRGEDNELKKNMDFCRLSLKGSQSCKI